MNNWSKLILIIKNLLIGWLLLLGRFLFWSYSLLMEILNLSRKQNAHYLRNVGKKFEQKLLSLNILRKYYLIKRMFRTGYPVNKQWKIFAEEFVSSINFIAQKRAVRITFYWKHFLNYIHNKQISYFPYIYKYNMRNLEISIVFIVIEK